MKKSVYDISKYLLQGSKYMYRNNVVAMLEILVVSYKFPLNQQTINDMKDALIDYFFDGFDPEFENESMYYWFEGLKPEWFELSGIKLHAIKND